MKKRYIPDLLVLGGLVVELKAVTELAPEHEAQLFNYMRIARQPSVISSTSATRAPSNGSA